MEAAKLAERSRHEVPEPGVVQDRAREPWIRGWQRGRPRERVEEREVHRLLAPEHGRVARAHQREHGEGAPEERLHERRLRGPSPAPRPPRAGAGGDREREHHEEHGGRERALEQVAEPPRGPGQEQQAQDPGQRETAHARQPRRGQRMGRQREGLHHERPPQEPKAALPDRIAAPDEAERSRRRASRPQEVGARQALRTGVFAQPASDLVRGQALPVAEDEHLRVVVDAQRFVRQLVRKLERAEPGPGGLLVDEIESEAVREEQAVEAGRHREAARVARDRADDSLRGQHDVLRARQLAGEIVPLRVGVGLVEREVHHPIAPRIAAGQRQREALVPVLREERGPLGHVPVDPFGSSRRRVRATIDREKRERAHRRGRGHGEQEGSTDTRRARVPQPRGRPQDEDRVDRQQVPRVLHVERARQQHEGHDPRRQHQRRSGSHRAQAPERDAASPQGRRSQRRAHAPHRHLPQVVRVLGNADVLDGVGQRAGVPHHRALLADLPPELRERENRVRLPREGGDDERAHGKTCETERTPVSEHERERERRQQRRGAHLGRERQPDPRAGEERIAVGARVARARRTRPSPAARAASAPRRRRGSGCTGCAAGRPRAARRPGGPRTGRRGARPGGRGPTP